MDTEVERWIDSHQEDMLDFLKTYISYRSPTGDEETVQHEFIEPFFRNQMDWDEVEIVDVSEDSDRPNVNARLLGEGNGSALLFNGHSDIVDVDEEQEEAWTYDPWNPTIADGRIYGRGANDMKGPNTAMIWATKAIMETGMELSGDLLMSVVVGEELAQQDVGSIPATEAHLQKVDEQPFCLNTEPTDNEIHTKSAGTFDFEVSIEGKEIHTSQKNLTRYPQRHGIQTGDEVGVDAAEIMIDIFETFRRLEHQWNMRYDDEIYGSGGYPVAMDLQGVGPIAINCTILEAGGYIASIPGQAQIAGHVYYPPFVDDEEFWTEMKEAVDAIATTNDWVKTHPPELDWKEMIDWPPFEVAVDHPGCQALGAIVEDVTGGQPVYSGFKAVCDNAQIQRDCGVDAVSLGPGDISMGAHGSDEYIPISQFMTAAKIYAGMIQRWCR